jgi:hypothetical protein
MTEKETDQVDNANNASFMDEGAAKRDGARNDQFRTQGYVGPAAPADHSDSVLFSQQPAAMDFAGATPPDAFDVLTPELAPIPGEAPPADPNTVGSTTLGPPAVSPTVMLAPGLPGGKGTPGEQSAGQTAVGQAEEGASLQREEQDKMQGHEAAMQEQKLRDDIENEKLSSQAEMISGFQKDQHARAQKYAAALESQSIKYQAAVDDLKSINPNPWADKGTGYQIGRAIAIGLSQMGVAFQGGQGANIALKMLDDGLNRDLQVQRNAYEQADNTAKRAGMVYDRMRGMYQDQNLAAQAAKTTSLALVAARAQAQLLAKAPQLRTLQDQQFIAKLQAEHEVGYRKLLDGWVKNGRASADQLDRERKMTFTESMQRTLAASKTPLGLFDELGEGFAKNAAVSKEVRDVYDGINAQILPGFAQMEDVLKRQDTSIEGLRSFAQASKMVVTGVRRMHGEGARINQQMLALDQAVASGNQGAAESLARQMIGDESGTRLILQGRKFLEDEANTRLRERTGRDNTYWKRRDLEKQLETAKQDRQRAAAQFALGTQTPDAGPTDAQ